MKAKKADPLRKLIRQIVGGYRSLKLAGQDEGYVVFNAEEPDTHYPVSIKILPRLLGSDPQIAQRFQGLARTLRQLNHPSILSIQEVGEEEGLPYLVTRAIERAKPLTDKLGQPWAVDEAADLVMQVGEALEHAYKKGVVHGSLKPDDILIGDGGRVRVSDFGLAELEDLVGVHLKEAASPYLAPERAAGGAADSAADVYSLAAILYSMLTKRQPQIVAGEVLPPSRFNPDVPPAMDAVVVKALAPDPAQRYPDVGSFLAAFGSVTLAPMVHKSTAAAGVRCPRCGAEDQTGKFCRRCGYRLKPDGEGEDLAPSGLDEPIMRTEIHIGSGVEMRGTVIAQPLAVASDEIAAQFPEPPESPQLNYEGLWPKLSEQLLSVAPEPLPMPEIEWADIALTMPDIPSFEDTIHSQEDD